MNKQRIQAWVDRLLARDQSYRPIELLKLSRRLDNSGLAGFQSGEIKVLEDALYGNLACVEALLESAADWARHLNLESEIESRSAGDAALFRKAGTDRLARTVWHRCAASPQADLFLDNRFAVARAQLVRHLLAGEHDRAEAALTEMARADAASDVQADAEHLVGALAWLDQPPSDIGKFLDTVDHELAPRAERFLGPRDGRRFLRRFWRHLAAAVDAVDFDPDQPSRHPALLAARSDDWSGVLEATAAVPELFRYADLLEAQANAAFKTDQRELALAAVCQLCWRHPGRAEAWLDQVRDQEIERRIEQFWDLDPPLDISLFPAWLLARAYPLPRVPDSPATSAAEALERVRSMRHNPSDVNQRRWFQQNHPELLQQWIAGKDPV